MFLFFLQNISRSTCTIAPLCSFCPLLKSPFPLPSLTDLNLDLLECLGPISTSSLLNLCSSCPLLQKTSITIGCRLLQDVPLGQVISLHSLVELEYTYHTCDRFIPFLNLPRLKQLHISSQEGKMGKLIDILPHNGHSLLSGTTSMSHLHKGSLQAIELSGNSIIASSTVCQTQINATSAEWFSKGTCIPFGQIGDLEIRGVYISPDFLFPLFKKLTKLTTSPMNLCMRRKTVQILELLCPLPGAGMPCPSL